jgi:hypothetical protein
VAGDEAEGGDAEEGGCGDGLGDGGDIEDECKVVFNARVAPSAGWGSGRASEAPLPRNFSRERTQRSQRTNGSSMFTVDAKEMNDPRQVTQRARSLAHRGRQEAA